MSLITRLFALLLVVAGTLIPSRGAISIISSNTFELALPAGPEARLAIDISSNLTAWTELTNVSRADRITFSDPNAPNASQRFYRIADADKLVLLKGYVDGGSKFGPVGGAQVRLLTSNLLSEIAETETDQNGYFQFNARMPIDQLPYVLFGATGFDGGGRQIYQTEAGGLMILSLQQKPLDTFWYPESGVTYRFRVTTGSRAGSQFTARFGAGALFDGDVMGEAWEASLGRGNFQISWFNMQVSYLQFIGSPSYLAFAGIPSPTGGTIAGNGIVVAEPPVSIAPAYPSSITFHLSKGLAAPHPYTLQLSGTYRAGYILRDGVTLHTNTSGRLAHNFYEYGSEIGFQFENYDYDSFFLTFKNATNGVLYGIQQVGTNRSRVEGTFEYTTNALPVVPATIVNRTVKFGDHTFLFGPNTYTDQIPGLPPETGTYSIGQKQNSLWVTLDGVFTLFLYFFDERTGVAEYDHMSAENVVMPFSID